MESSPQNQFSQALQSSDTGTDQHSHILRPEEIQEGEPEVLAGNIKTGEQLAAFDYEVAIAMAELSPAFQVSSSPISLEDEARLEKESVPGTERPKILRPNSLKVAEEKKKWGMIQTVQATVAAGVMSAAAMAPQPAQAGGINGFEQAAAVVAAGIINNKLFNNSPVSIKIDQNNNGVLVAKSPQEMAMNLAPQISQETMNYARAIGINIINDGMIFKIENANNPAEEITIVKYYNPTQFTTGISVRQAVGGGILLSVQYVKDNLPKAQLITIRTFANGKMGAVTVGN